MKTIKLNHKIVNDKYTEYLYEAFDIQNKEESNVEIQNNIILNFDWQIGVIYGGSGTGKSTLLKNFGTIQESNFDNSKSLISNFDWLEPQEATYLLSSMGLSSVPTWLRPFHTLSNGEQYRASLAYVVGKAQENEIILIDEYTSVVDREVAKAMSNALQKYVRRTNKKVILASCHFDIMEWLQPDWVYSPNKGRVERPDYLRQRPSIELEVFRCRYETWKLFKQHHYLTDELLISAKTYIFLWNDKPVAFIGIIPFPSGVLQNAFRITRVVVLPDYQGLGIGGKICDYISKFYKTDNKTMYIKTANPALWNYFNKSNNWTFCSETTGELKETMMASRDKKNNNLKKTSRISKSFKYTGETTKEDISIIKFKGEVFKDIAQNQISLF